MHVEVTKVIVIRVEKPRKKKRENKNRKKVTESLLLKLSMKGDKMVGMIEWRQLNEVICENCITVSGTQARGAAWVVLCSERKMNSCHIHTSFRPINCIQLLCVHYYQKSSYLFLGTLFNLLLPGSFV
jgi:hypothetical protein